jgi:hypothetical protein
MKNRTKYVTILSVVSLVAAAFASAQATFTFKCPKDGVVVSSGSAQPPRCGSCGSTMIRKLY